MKKEEGEAVQTNAFLALVFLTGGHLVRGFMEDNMLSAESVRTRRQLLRARRRRCVAGCARQLCSCLPDKASVSCGAAPQTSAHIYFLWKISNTERGQSAHS